MSSFNVSFLLFFGHNNNDMFMRMTVLLLMVNCTDTGVLNYQDLLCIIIIMIIIYYYVFECQQNYLSTSQNFRLTAKTKCRYTLFAHGAVYIVHPAHYLYACTVRAVCSRPRLLAMASYSALHLHTIALVLY